MSYHRKTNSILKAGYNKILERSFVISLIIIGLLFYVFPIFDVGTKLMAELPDIIEPIKIPPTRHPEKRIRPDKPVIPVQNEDEEMLDPVDIDFLEMQKDWFINKPQAPLDDPDEVVPFFAVSKKPMVLKKVSPVYPEIAQKARIEGIVVVEVLIGTDGKVEKATIYKSIPMLDHAALEAAKKFVFSPGEQRDRKVKVRMTIPFSFSLRD
jgi:protein TonB